MRRLVPALLSLAAFGCSGAQGLQGSASRLAGDGSGASAPASSPADSAGGAGSAQPAPEPSDEGDRAGTPQQVSGAFLADCGRALAGGYGCAFLDPVTKGKLAAAVSDAAVTVHLGDGSTDTPKVEPAPAGSVYHILFSEPADRWLSATSVGLTATVNGAAVATDAKTRSYDEVPGGDMNDTAQRYAARVIFAITDAPPADDKDVANLAAKLAADTTQGERAATISNYILNDDAVLQRTESVIAAGWAQAFWKLPGDRADLVSSAKVKALMTIANNSLMWKALQNALQDAQTFSAAKLTGGATQANYAAWLAYVFAAAHLPQPCSEDLAAINNAAGANPSPAALYTAASSFLAQTDKYSQAMLGLDLSAYAKLAPGPDVSKTGPYYQLLCANSNLSNCSDRLDGTSPLLIGNVTASDAFFQLNP